MMPESAKATAGHLGRAALVYVRQSTALQVERHRESTARQYALVEHAAALGWHRDQVTVIDEDLGLSGASAAGRGGFARMTSEVAMGRVGIVLGLEVSRLARNNADWYRLLDICGITDTLIGDADGLYHPGAYNDRLVLGLKGTMSEAELHILRARLNGGASCAAPYRSVSSGARRRARSVFIPTRPSSAPSARSSSALPSSARCAGSGCGSRARGWLFRRSRSTPARSAGAVRPTPRSTTS
jgi:DNA invertase Pin-like site-specific DNA recombinase